jgi:hypothetical protein
VERNSIFAMNLGKLCNTLYFAFANLMILKALIKLMLKVLTLTVIDITKI